MIRNTNQYNLMKAINEINQKYGKVWKSQNRGQLEDEADKQKLKLYDELESLLIVVDKFLCAKCVPSVLKLSKLSGTILN